MTIYIYSLPANLSKQFGSEVQCEKHILEVSVGQTDVCMCIHTFAVHTYVYICVCLQYTQTVKNISNIIHIYKYIEHIMPHITNHIQYVTSQISHVTNQISPIIYCLSHITSFTSSISSMNQILGYNSLSALKRRNKIKLLDPSTLVNLGPLTLARTQPLWSIFRVYDHKALGLFCTWPPKSSREQTWDSRGEENHKNSMMVVQFQNPVTSIVRMSMRI